MESGHIFKLDFKQTHHYFNMGLLFPPTYECVMQRREKT